jgi:hypothetical protein
VVSVHGGQIDTENGVITVNVDKEQLLNAPSFNRADLDMSSTSWETGVVSYWSDTIGMDMTLTSECTVQAADLSGASMVTGTITSTQTTTQTVPVDTPSGEGMVTVNKIALASNVLSAQVQDGNGTLLGQVQEVLVTPATGRLEFVAVRLEGSEATGGPVVLVPLRALNLMLDSPAQLHLVLLVDSGILEGAPTWDEQAGSLSQGWDDDAFEYWSQHVQMTREGDQ